MQEAVVEGRNNDTGDGRCGVVMKRSDKVRDKGTVVWRRTVHSLLLFLFVTPGQAGEAIERPYILWNRSDIQGIKARIEKEDWAKQELERMRANAPSLQTRSLLENYFLTLMTGDKEIAAYESVVLSNVCRVLFGPEYAEARTAWIGGKLSRMVNYDLPVRMDFFWDTLSAEQRRGLDTYLNKWAQDDFAGGWDTQNGLSGLFLALGTGDKRLIRGGFEAGPQKYLDSLADGYFSPSGENPDVNLVGGMLLWCRAVERLGMNDIGFGYTGKPSTGSGQGTGGTVRKMMEGYFVAGDPRIDIPGGSPFYGRAAMTLMSRIKQRNFVEFGGTFGIPGQASTPTGMPSRLSYALPNLGYPRDVFRAPFVVGRLPSCRVGWPWLQPFRTDLFYAYDKSPRDLVGKPQIDYRCAGGRGGGVRSESMGIQLPMALEMAHKQWPDARFDYFLARMDMRDSETYYPSLFWNVDPFPKAKATPPPVRSMILPTVGMALLRSEEGEAFWESPAPYAVLRLAEGLGEELAPSALSLHSLQAFNRPIYRHVLPMAGAPVAVGHGVTHNTVVVDNAPRVGVGKGAFRSFFDPAVKFVDVRSTPYEYKERVADENKAMTFKEVTKVSGIRPGVVGERALALTREYLLDVFRLESEQEHTYDWMVHALGSASPDDAGAWKATTQLDSTLGISVAQSAKTSIGAPFSYKLRQGFNDQHMFDKEGATWSLNVVQSAMSGEGANTVMGREWYDRKIGARVTMLGEPGTGAFYSREVCPRRLTAQEESELNNILNPKARAPELSGGGDKIDREAIEVPIRPAGAGPVKKAAEPAKDAAEKPFTPVGEAVVASYPETGGVVLIAERRAATTVFVALHEPFEKMKWRIEEFRRVQQTNDAVVVAIRGKGVDDRVMIRQGTGAQRTISLSDAAESFQFRGFAYARIGADVVTACGELKAMKVKVQGTPRLVLNGKDTEAVVRDGFLAFGSGVNDD